MDLLEPPAPKKIVLISIESLKTQEQVHSIENALRNEPSGIFDVKINLEYKEARITFDSQIFYPEMLAGKISSLGFAAEVISIKDASRKRVSLADSLAVDPQEAKVADIELNNLLFAEQKQQIERILSSKPGVSEVHVSLMDQQAQVRFDEAVVSADALTETLTSLGYGAKVLQVQDGRRHRVSTRGRAVSWLLDTEVNKPQCKFAAIHIIGLHGSDSANALHSLLTLKAGIYQVHVSSTHKRVDIWFDSVLWNSEEIADVIDQAGYVTNLMAEKENQDFTPDSEDDVFETIPEIPNWARESDLLIQTALCNVCAHSIEQILSQKDGLFDVSINLEEQTVKSAFDPALWSGEQLVQELGSLGFEAVLISTTDVRSTTESLMLTPDGQRPITSREFYSHALEKCTFAITGMTCASCVAYIENEIKKISGVSTVMVALVAGKAEVKFDPVVADPVDIAAQIKSLGYGAVLLEEKYEQNEELEISISGLFDSAGATKFQVTLMQQPGVTSVSLTSDMRKASVKFDAEMLGPRDIVKTIETTGCTCKVIPTMEAYSTKTHDTNERTKWRNALLLSLLFGVPAIVVSLYFTTAKWHSRNRKDQIQIIKGLSLDNLLMFLLVTPVQFIAGRHFYLSTFRALQRAKANLDFLIVFTTTLTYLYSTVILITAMVQRWPHSPLTFFDTTPVLIIMLCLGTWLDSVTKEKSSDVLDSLRGLQADTTVLVEFNTEGQMVERRIDATLVQQGDLIKILPGTKIPVDGKVLEGSSTTDESFLTGESLPVLKHKGDVVFAGSSNNTGALLIQTTFVGRESTLVQMAKLLNNAHMSREQHKSRTDIVGSYFVPLVVIAALAVMLVWIYIGFSDIDTFHSLMDQEELDELKGNTTLSSEAQRIRFACECMIGCLAIACPSTFALVIPSALLVISSVARSNGILIKGTDPLNVLHKVGTIAFDKTGTLTEGKLRLSRISLLVSQSFAPLSTLLAVVGAAETHSPHPMARSIARFCKQLLKPETQQGSCDGFRLSDGHAVHCIVCGIEPLIEQASLKHLAPFEGSVQIGDVTVVQAERMEEPEHHKLTDSNGMYDVILGDSHWLENHGLASCDEVKDLVESEQKHGRTAILCAINGIIVAVFSCNDPVTDEAILTVYRLQKLGLHTVLITGDNALNARAAAKQVGIRLAYSELLSGDKQRKMAQFRQTNSVAAVSKGLASATLASADVGISLASDCESSGAVVLDSLSDLLPSMDLSDTANNRIKLNFFLSAAYNILAIPVVAGLGRPLAIHPLPAQPWIVIAAMFLSLITVTISTLLLKLYKKPTDSNIKLTESWERHMKRLSHWGNEMVEVHRGLHYRGRRLPNRKRSTSGSNIGSRMSKLSDTVNRETRRKVSPSPQELDLEDLATVKFR